MFICPRCLQEFNSYNSLSKHTRTKYKLSGEALYQEYYNIPSVPLCKCGCGIETKWRSDRGYAEYATGHNSIGESNPMYGQTHSHNARKNISIKRKAKFASGELKVWCDGLTKETDDRLRVMGENTSNNTERSAKISSALLGRKKSDEQMQKIWAGQRKWLATHHYNNPSSIEVAFQNILNVLNLPHTQQFSLDKFTYDFYIQSNNLLVEIDGDFYHSNPVKYPNGPEFPIQKRNFENDKKKDEIARASGYTLLRFWETDIKNNPQQVIIQLLAEINKPSQ